MVQGSNERFVIRHSPPNKYNKTWFFSIQQAMFVPFEDATIFRSKDIAEAFANEFGVKLDKHTDILDLKDIDDTTSE